MIEIAKAKKPNNFPVGAQKIYLTQSRRLLREVQGYLKEGRS